MKSDVEVFGTVGGENYWPPLSDYRVDVILQLYREVELPSQAQYEFATTFLKSPPAGLWFTQYETMEYLWLGERAA